MLNKLAFALGERMAVLNKLGFWNRLALAGLGITLIVIPRNMLQARPSLDEWFIAITITSILYAMAYVGLFVIVAIAKWIWQKRNV